MLSIMSHASHYLIASHHHTFNHGLIFTLTSVPAPADADASTDAPDNILAVGAPRLTTLAHAHFHSSNSVCSVLATLTAIIQFVVVLLSISSIPPWKLPNKQFFLLAFPIFTTVSFFRLPIFSPPLPFSGKNESHNKDNVDDDTINYINNADPVTTFSSPQEKSQQVFSCVAGMWDILTKSKAVGQSHLDNENSNIDSLKHKVIRRVILLGKRTAF